LEKGGACQITFDEAFTPHYFDTVPNVVYDGMTIAMMVDPKSSQTSLRDGMEPFSSIKIG